MLTPILKSYRQKKGLINFFFLTYLDKGLSFALPLCVLFILKDKSLYTLIEVVFSYATIVMVLIELGLSNYLFWGYKQSPNKEDFIHKAKTYFRAVFFIYAASSLILLLYFGQLGEQAFMLFVLVATRTLFTFFVNFHSNIFRLIDSPAGIYKITIGINLASFLMLMVAYYLSMSNAILYFFLPSMLLAVIVSIKFLMEIREFKWKELVSFLKSTLGFSWPIILNVLAMSFVNNYAKIYAYGNLSESEMVQISYVMRVGILIQLTHVSFSSYFSKALFMDQSKKFNTSMFKQYSLVLISSLIVAFLIIQITNFFLSNLIFIPIDLSTVLFLVYIILWCYIGYLELYFGVMNANRRILYYTIVSSIIYIALLKFSGEVNLLQLSVFMVISAAVNVTLVVVGLTKLRVFNSKHA